MANRRNLFRKPSLVKKCQRLLFPAKYHVKKKEVIWRWNSKRESVDLDTMCSMSLKSLSTHISRSQTRRLANMRIGSLRKWFAVLARLTRYYYKIFRNSEHLPYERQHFASRWEHYRGIYGSQRVVRSWHRKYMQKNFKRFPEKCQTSICGEIFSRSAIINILWGFMFNILWENYLKGIREKVFNIL